VCIAVCLVRRLRRPCNYLLVSLAVSDLCVALLVMPMALLYEVLGKWPFGRRVCDTWVAFDVLSCTASILNLCMISVDRYWAITRPLDYGVKRTPGRMLLCVGLVWLTAACISLPPLLVLGNEHDGDQCVVCQEFGYQIYATLGSFYIPLGVMAAVYCQIFQAAKRIVDEEKKAQSHLLAQKVVKSSTVIVAGTGSTGAGRSPNPNSTLVQVCHHHQLLEQSDEQQGGLPGDATPLQSIHRRNLPEWKESLMANQNGNSHPSPAAWHCDDLWKNPSESLPSDRATHPALPAVLDAANVSQSLTTPDLCVHREAPPPQRQVLHQPPVSRVRLRFALNKERKASTTLGIIMSAFTLCWLPFFVLALVRPFLNSADQIPRWLSSLFLWLGYANSFLNPVIYATTNKDFRLPFKEILCLRCKSLNDVMREDFYQFQYGETRAALRSSDVEKHFACSATRPCKSRSCHFHPHRMDADGSAPSLENKRHRAGAL